MTFNDEHQNTVRRRVLPAPAALALAATLLLATSLAVVPSAAQAAPPTAAIEQATLGNIFTVDEAVSIPVRTSASHVQWSVVDFAAELVAEGDTAVTDGVADLRPSLPDAGYFELTAVPVAADGTSGASLHTTLAVVPATTPDPASSRYGAMTHFAQGWSTELMPLIAEAGLGHIRDEAYWSQVERTRGTYELPAYAEGYAQAAAAAGIDVLPVLSFANPLYDVNPDGSAQAWSIRRWTAPSAGTIAITGWWRGAQVPGIGGDGTGMRIFVDGSEIYFESRTDTQPITIALRDLEISAGSVVDFVVTPGDEDARNGQYDGARYVMDVWQDGQGTNSSSTFSGIQGQDGWSYGGAVIPAGQWDDYDPAADFVPMTWSSANSRWQSAAFTWSTISQEYSAPDMRVASAVSPYTDAGREGFANYADALIDLFSAEGTPPTAVEVWNEWNGAFLTGPALADRPAYYADLLAATASTLRAEHSDVDILGTASVQIPTGYLERLFELGVLDDLDAIAVHPYVQNWDVPWPELVWTEIADLNAQVARFNGGETKPIWMTEFGLSNRDRGYQAKFNARQLALMSSYSNVDRMYQYLMVDDGSFPYMGLLKAPNAPEGPYTPNPAYVATAVLIDQIGSAEPLGRELVDELSDLYVMSFDDDGEPVRAVWSATAEGDALRVGATGPVTVTDMMGASETLTPGPDGVVIVPLDDSVQYVRGDITVLGGTNVLPVADSFLQFGDTQGTGGWQYGFERDGGFEPMRYTPEFTWNWQWQGDDDQSLKVTQPGGYPSLEDPDAAAVRRWTSTVDGPVTIRGTIGYAGLDYRIRVDGETVWNERLASGTQQAYDVTTEVQEGSVVDFVLTHPDGVIDHRSDKTVFTARIFADEPEPPVAQGPPAASVLWSDNGWDTGLLDGDYTVTSQLWWGENAERITLLENGQAIAEQHPSAASPDPQRVDFPIFGRPDGEYRYTAAAANGMGTTLSKELVVRVADAKPGKPVLRHDADAAPGAVSVTVDMWWGTNATELVLFDGDFEVACTALIADTPRAQHWIYDATGLQPGTHTFRAELVNAAGRTSSEPLVIETVAG